MNARRLLLLWLLALLICGQPATGDDVTDWTKDNLATLSELYRHFHSHPELSYLEKETSARLAGELKKTGAKVTAGVGGYGVVALLENGKGPTVMMRCDMDALPVVEQTNLVYASKVKVKDPRGVEVGVMHACGHDVHMTNLVAVARFLSANKNRWSGTAMFLCQPAEERGGGAKAMLEDGLFKRFPKPDYALAMHVDSKLATGRVAYRPGYACANVDTVSITMKGRGGHGAQPHTTIDPVLLGAKLVLELQTIVSREIKPTDPAVITVGSIHGGTKANIIGNTCDLKITVRSYSDEVRSHLKAAIQRKARAVAAGAEAPEPVVDFSEGTPSLSNDDKLVNRIVPVFQRVVGAANVELAEPTMGGEDFSRYGRAGVPIFMYRIGAVDARRLASFTERDLPPPSLHSPVFYPDVEDALLTSVPVMAAAALELLKPEK